MEFMNGPFVSFADESSTSKCDILWVCLWCRGYPRRTRWRRRREHPGRRCSWIWKRHGRNQRKCIGDDCISCASPRARPGLSLVGVRSTLALVPSSAPSTKAIDSTSISFAFAPVALDLIRRSTGFLPCVELLSWHEMEARDIIYSLKLHTHAVASFLSTSCKRYCDPQLRSRRRKCTITIERAPIAHRFLSYSDLPVCCHEKEVGSNYRLLVSGLHVSLAVSDFSTHASNVNLFYCRTSHTGIDILHLSARALRKTCRKQRWMGILHTTHLVVLGRVCWIFIADHDRYRKPCCICTLRRCVLFSAQQCIFCISPKKEFPKFLSICMFGSLSIVFS